MVAAVRKNGSPNHSLPHGWSLLCLPSEGQASAFPRPAGDALVWVELGRTLWVLPEVGGRESWVEGTQGVPRSPLFMAVGRLLDDTILSILTLHL